MVKVWFKDANDKTHYIDEDLWMKNLENIAEENEKLKLTEADEDLDKVKKKLKKDQKPQADISLSPKVITQILFNYRIREDLSHNVIGESGNKTIVITPENHKHIGTVFWNKVVKALDYNFFSQRKAGTALKFYLEVDFQLGTQPQTFRIYFTPDDGKFEITGHSYNQNISTSGTLKDLDIRLGKAFELAYNL